MIRKIIKIDRDKCDGCGICAVACHEGAIAVIDGKAELLKEDYCDGLGDCLPACPAGAISFEEREAAAYDKLAVERHMAERENKTADKMAPTAKAESELMQWPIQIKLVPITAPYFDNAKLLVAADCTAFAFRDFHRKFIRGHITLIGCPKLDMEDYTEKLTAIIKENNVRSVTVVRMEVPCCGGLEHAVKSALQASGKFLPWQVATISTQGEILE